MSAAVVCLSHSPLLEAGDPPPEVVEDIEVAFGRARDFIEDFAPDVVVSFAPDHYNGFFYDLMPQFCIGYEARGVGDFGSSTTPFRVPGEVAKNLAHDAVESGIEVAISLDMRLDHGAVQPIEVLFGAADAVPVVPVFINAVARPLTPMRRIRELGQQLGRTMARRPERVLFIGSGGLSHDPPVPKLESANEQQLEMILRGRNLSAEDRAARTRRVIDGAKAFVAGTSAIQDLNPEWDRGFLDTCEKADPYLFDQLVPDEMARVAGNSVHEVRTWVAALSALSAFGSYETTSRYYRPVKELIAGFGVVTARTS